MQKKNQKRTKGIIILLSSLFLASILMIANFYLSIDAGKNKIVLEYQSEYKDKTPSASLTGKVFAKMDILWK